MGATKEYIKINLAKRTRDPRYFQVLFDTVTLSPMLLTT